MKFLKVTLIAFLLPILAGAQNVEIKEGTTKMGKKKMWAFSASYPYGKHATASTMDQNLIDAKMKRTSHKKGLNTYKGGLWPAISENRGDYYYTVKSRKGKSTITLAFSKGYDNFVTSTNDAAIAGKITQYLQALDGQISNALAIEKNEAELKEIEKKSKAINKELEKNQTEQAKKANELEMRREKKTEAVK